MPTFVQAKATPSFLRSEPLSGLITPLVQGKVIDGVYTDGKYLLIETTDGHLIKIKWEGDSPVLHSIDARVIVKGVAMTGIKG